MLWFFARERFRRYVACVSLLALMGFATYALFPAAPPWMASQLGEIDHVTRSIGLISGHIPIIDCPSLFDHARVRESSRGGAVAARRVHAAHLDLPLELRAAWGQATPRRLSVAMAFALSYTAEHYLVDVLLGWVYAVAAVWIVHRVADWIRGNNKRKTESSSV